METELKDLVGRKINKIFISPRYLKFETDKGDLTYEVEGDCCSSSFFYDFYGVKQLLKGTVKEVKDVELHPTDLFVIPDKGDSTTVYGYAITTEGNDTDYPYGDRTSVFSFRNESNGYYGGYIRKVEKDDMEVLPEITDDIVEVK